MRQFSHEAVLLTLAISASLVVADEKRELVKALGSQSCSSTACHGRQPDYSSRPKLREEFSRWLATDPHARSKETLASEKYQTILVKVSRCDDGQVDPRVQTRCAKCHDPQALAVGSESVSSFGQGIGCESCHGSAKKWLARHYERGIERSELLSLGMMETNNLDARAKLCASCHVGSAEQDLNHDMIAAGHPPLRFDLAAYHDLIPHKHWDDSRERLEKRDFQVQLWAAGQRASAEARLELLAARCGSTDRSSWPEFAEYNCFSCHQTFAGPKSTASKSIESGRPSWSRWHLTFVDEPTVKDLRTLFTDSFPADAEQVREASVIARERLGRTGSPTYSDTLLRTLSGALSEPNANTDWETRSQQYLALLAVERSYRDELAKRQHFAQLTRSEYDGRLREHRSLAEELVVVRTRLQFESGWKQAVLSDEPRLFREHREQLGPQLRTIADQLRERMQQLP